MTRTLALVALALTAFTVPSLAAPAFTALPGPFETRNPPVEWKATAPDALTMTAGPNTNWFVAPWDRKLSADSAPTLLFRPEGNFTLSAKVSLKPKSRWDAGVLTLFVDKDNWAKLCLENANNDGKPLVVMVATHNGVSDDSYTNFVAPDGTLYLSVSRNGPGFYFNASRDGKDWTMFRAFTLEGDQNNLKAGLIAQSPAGDGITVTFSDIRYSTKP